MISVRDVELWPVSVSKMQTSSDAAHEIQMELTLKKYKRRVQLWLPKAGHCGLCVVPSNGTPRTIRCTDISCLGLVCREYGNTRKYHAYGNSQVVQL